MRLEDIDRNDFEQVKKYVEDVAREIQYISCEDTPFMIDLFEYYLMITINPSFGDKDDFWCEK